MTTTTVENHEFVKAYCVLTWVPSMTRSGAVWSSFINVCVTCAPFVCGNCAGECRKECRRPCIAFGGGILSCHWFMLLWMRYFVAWLLLLFPAVIYFISKCRKVNIL
mgnify:CR=1 FL=1